MIFYKNKGSVCRRICLLCQQTLLENMNMTSNYDVTNSAHQIQITTICHWMKPPPLQFYAYSLVLARSRERLNNPPVLRVWSMIPSSCGKACARRAEKIMPNNVGQDAALFDASANWKSFRHGAIKLDSCLHVLVERYKDGK